MPDEFTAWRPEMVSLADIRVDETYWPRGSSEVMRRWLVESYDPATMPPIHVARGEDGYFWLLGWDRSLASEKYDYPLLYEAHVLLGHPDEDDCGFTFIDEDEDDE